MDFIFMVAKYLFLTRNMPGVQIEKTCCNITEAEIDQYDPQFTL